MDADLKVALIEAAAEIEIAKLVAAGEFASEGVVELLDEEFDADIVWH